jgi:uncharacterized Zn ribbon protein
MCTGINAQQQTMKNKLSLLSLGVVALFVASCSDDDLGSSSLRSANAILTASVEGYEPSTPATRAGFGKPDNGTAPFNWTKDDQIGVTTITTSSENVESEKLDFSLLTINEDGVGKTSASFSGSISGKIGSYAVYPYNDGNHKIAAKSDETGALTLTFNFPDSYKYSSLDSYYYDTETGTSGVNSWNVAMFAKVDANGNAKFLHLGGAVIVLVPNIPEGKGTFTLTADKAITGDFTADISAEYGDNNPATIEASTVASDKNNKVTITYENAVDKQTGAFYVPLPVGTYNLKFTLKDKDDKLCASTGQDGVEITRKKLYGISLSSEIVTGSGVKEVESVSDANTNLSSNDVVVVNSKVEGTSEITIPSTSGDTETSKTVVLNSVASNSTIKLSDGNTSISDASKSVDNVTVSLPTSATATTEGGSETVTAPSLTVELPNTTVTVEANTGSTTIEEAEVSTADYTFIVGSGVKIKHLKVKKGNVVLKSGSTVEKISATGTDNTVNVSYEDKASCPDGFSTSTDTRVVYGINGSLDGLKNAFKEGGEIKLTEDVNILNIKTLDTNNRALALPAGKSLTIDLNGHTITGANKRPGYMYAQGELTIKDSKGGGKYVQDASAANQTNTGLIVVDGASAKLTITSGTFETAGEYIVAFFNGAGVDIQGGNFHAGEFCLSGNGTSTGKSTVTVKDATLKSDKDYAIYLPMTGSTTLTNLTVEGAAGAVAIQRGTLTIESGTYTSLGTVTLDTDGDDTAGLQNAALAIIARYGNLTANINGGTFTAKGDATTVTATHNKVVTTYTKDVNVKAAATFSDLSILTAASDATYDLSGALTLANNLTVSTLSLSGKKSVTVDLNDKTLTVDQTEKSYINLDVATDEIVYKNGNITLGDGNGNDAAINMTKGTFKLDGVTLDASKWHTAIKAQNKDSYVEITNESTVKGRCFTMSTNASSDGTNLVDGCDAHITLKNSTFEADKTGFMNNVPATINMTDCKFYGNHQGALLRGGTYTIEGCTFTLKAELSPDHSECHNSSAWGSGNETAFAAIVIGDRTNGSYPHDTNVTFVGTKNTGVVDKAYTYATQFPAAYIYGVSTNKVTINGDMSGFKASGYSQDIVTGGNVVIGGETKSVTTGEGKNEAGFSAGSF